MAEAAATAGVFGWLLTAKTAHAPARRQPQLPLHPPTSSHGVSPSCSEKKIAFIAHRNAAGADLPSTDARTTPS